jgi:hypothetical protein
VVAVNRDEAQLRAAVQKQLLKLGDYGVVWHHCSHPWHCSGSSGLPDLIIAGPGGLVLAELKSATGELSAPQQAWQWALSHSTCFRSVVWRPADWNNGLVTAELNSLTR